MAAVTFVEQVLMYAERGWPVFPLWGLQRVNGQIVCRCGHDCDSPGKHPHVMAPHGFKLATIDSCKIETWWQRDPIANVGLACGVAFDVLDVDHDDFATGVSDLPDCETDGGPVVLTGSGRFHLYFAATGIGRKIKGFSKHCDWLGIGGYVIAPPSRHIAGDVYRWYAPFELALTRPPQQLLDVLDPPPASSSGASAPVGPSRATRTRNGWSADGLLGRMARAVEGERNDVLLWCVARIADGVRDGRVDERRAREHLDELTLVATRAGLGVREIERTIRSGLDAR